MRGKFALAGIGLLIITLVIITLVAAAQPSGSWDFSLNVLPSVSFDYSELTLSFPLWETLEGTFALTVREGGPATAAIKLKGRLGIGYLSSKAQFDLEVPAYKSAGLALSLPWNGIFCTFEATHWAADYAPPHPCLQTSSAYIEYKITLFSSPVNATMRFEDCGNGVTWSDTKIILTPLSLCCDIHGWANFIFSKNNGFEELDVRLQNIPLCLACETPALKFDLQFRFAANEKVVSIYPKTQFPSDLCVSIYGDIDWEKNSFKGIYLRGFRISCAFNGCQRIELKTAFTPGTLGFPFEEFESIKIETCLPSCCGEKGALGFTLYFGPHGQFGLSRLLANAKIPLNSYFLVKAEVEIPAAGEPRGKVGLSFKF